MTAAAAAAAAVEVVGIVAVVAVREGCCCSLPSPSPCCPLLRYRRRSASGLENKHRQRKVKTDDIGF